MSWPSLKKKIDGAAAVVTGAASGIGRALTEELGKRGYAVALSKSW